MSNRSTADEAPATLSAIHPDILETHILTRLDGCTLASAACTSTQLHSLAVQESLWTNICRSRWPSTAFPRVHNAISSFPNVSRSFFSDSFPIAIANSENSNPAISGNSLIDPRNPSELISAVDIYYKNKLIFSKFTETETLTGWFRCSPFRIDLLEPKDTVATAIPNLNEEDLCRDLEEDLVLSWILIDPIGNRAMDLSSHKPVSVQRHWLSGEVQIRFSTVLSDLVQCGIIVTCGGGQAGETRITEVCSQMEDMDGMHLNGKDSLVILKRALEGKRVKTRSREEEGKRRFEEFQERKRLRKEKRLRTEGALDMLCVVFGVLGITSLGLCLFWR